MHGKGTHVVEKGSWKEREVGKYNWTWKKVTVTTSSHFLKLRGNSLSHVTLLTWLSLVCQDQSVTARASLVSKRKQFLENFLVHFNCLFQLHVSLGKIWKIWFFQIRSWDSLNQNPKLWKVHTDLLKSIRGCLWIPGFPQLSFTEF